MEIIKFIEQKKIFYNNLLKIIENDEETDLDDDYKDFFDNLDNLTVHDEFKEALELISKISENHYRGPNFISKIEKIFLHISEKIRQSFTNQEIFDIFKDNKRILLLLVQTKLITFDDSIIQYILSISKFEGEDKIKNLKDKLISLIQKKPSEKETYLHYSSIYFYPEIKDSIDEKTKRMIFEEAEKIDPNFLNNFEEKRANGENENYICEMIRSDLVEDFVVYVNKKNTSLNTIINPSIFETNILLITKPASLIEYAAFYGSIQIVQYLKFNNVDLNPDLWIYSIHSNNPELIHFLEENQVEPPNNSFKTCLKEAIKCHHNNIADYIIDNLIKEDDKVFDIEHEFNENVASYSFNYDNYFFYPENVDDKHIFLYLCQFNYPNMVKLFLKYKDIDVNYMIVFL